MGSRRFPDAASMSAAIDRCAERVRALHEDVFYRPIVAATACFATRSAPGLATASPSRYHTATPAARFTHIAASPRGTTRRAVIQRHLLPVFISWPAGGADPDMG